VNQTAILEEPPDFSLVLDGPLFQFFRWAHLSGVDERIGVFAAMLQMGATTYDLEEAELCYAPHASQCNCSNVRQLGRATGLGIAS
jgi:hypothetical protein